MLREPCYAKSIGKGRVSRYRYALDPKQQQLESSCVRGIGNHHPTSNGEYNWRSKVYHVPRVLTSLQSINLSPERHHSKRSLTRISEEFDLDTTADEMTFVEHNNDFQQGSASNVPQQTPQNYGSGLGDASFVEDDDDYEFFVDEGLARDGLYRGSYRSLLLLYTVVPLTTLLSFICLALVPTLVFTTQTPSLFPYPPYLPFPILEALTATALWSLSYLLRDFLYATALFIVSSSSSSSSTIIITILSATLQTTSNLLLRQIAIPILLIPYYYYSSTKHLAQQHYYPTWKDDAFKRVWWVALGWAAAEAVVGVKQGYESITLYKDVLVNANMPTLDTEMGSRERPAAPKKQNEDEGDDVDTTPKQMKWKNQQLKDSITSSPHIQQQQYSLSIGSKHMLTEEASLPISDEHQPLLRTLRTRLDNESDERLLQAENDVERDLDQLIALKNREELEEVYGIPFIRIPVFISCLHRINSILSSLGICLLFTAAYMQSTFAIIAPSSLSPLDNIIIVSSHRPTASNQYLVITTLPILIIYALLAMMHTPLILPRIGIHTFVYVELLVSLGVFFGGLAVWDALS